ncbi:MAG: 8-amino-7-oxononanoate synthase [Candidatus Schekmanbacteria bacterium]|nr:8-amino-7-oxononanoate synthase [Candidatus Schekmanbacteria bacterium]
MNQIWQQFFEDQINNLHQTGRYRFLRTIASPQDAEVICDGRRYINFCSNNYLGLANHPALRIAAINAIQKYGWGAGASRLICGNMQLHQELETQIARFKSSQAALVFPAGFMTNTGAISALVQKDDAVFIDRLNHASIVDGCRMSPARLLVYGHNDMDDLKKSLQRTRPRFRKILIVTDSVFSMDGDLAPLPELVAIAAEFDALLMVDEAHATGVLGENGRGALEYFNLEGRAGVVMGTLSKGIGSLGGFIAADQILIDYLRNFSRSFIYTTAPPPAFCAAACAGLQLIEQEKWRRDKLKENVLYLKQQLTSLGSSCDNLPVPIIPLIIGAEAKTIALSNYLQDQGILAPPIRPPTVAPNTCRLRITVMATHTKEHIDKLIDALRKA